MISEKAFGSVLKRIQIKSKTVLKNIKSPLMIAADIAAFIKDGILLAWS